MSIARKMPSRATIAAHWVGRHEKIREDDDGSYCFACGDTFQLERCHIVPRCQGGTDGVENLHVLCALCHKKSEWLTGKAYWRWFDGVKHESHLAHAFRRMMMHDNNVLWASLGNDMSKRGISRAQFMSWAKTARVGA